MPPNKVACHRILLSWITANQIQRPTNYDGQTPWEFAQFQIISDMSNWDDQQKAAFLATSLKGTALNVLGNSPREKRQNCNALVDALASRFGTAQRLELSRVRFKNRIKQREEPFQRWPKTLSGRVGYRIRMHRQPSKMSLHETNLSMRYQMMKCGYVKQERPSTLQKALEIALELESFQIASRQRYLVIRNVRIGGRKARLPARPRCR